jgi:hypothetical protein
MGSPQFAGANLRVKSGPWVTFADVNISTVQTGANQSGAIDLTPLLATDYRLNPSIQILSTVNRSAAGPVLTILHETWGGSGGAGAVNVVDKYEYQVNAFGVDVLLQTWIPLPKVGWATGALRYPVQTISLSATLGATGITVQMKNTKYRLIWQA